METPARFTFAPNGSTKAFPIPALIKGDNYVRIDVDSVTINDRNKYDIVNNAVVFVDAADVPNGSQLDVLVVQTDEGITNLGAIISVDIVAQNIASVNTVATDIASVVNTSANILDVNTVAGSIANVNAVGPSIANVDIVAPAITSVNTVAGDIAAVVAVALDELDINTVAGSIASVNTAAASIASINTAATNLAAIQAAPAAATEAQNSEINAAGHELVAGTHATNANNSAVAAAASETNAAASETNAAASAASAAAALDNFDDRYLGVKTSDPTLDNDGAPLVQGALYFNSTTKKMMVYDSSTWLESSSVAPVSMITYTYTAGASQTVYSGVDNNSAVLDYTINNIIVLVNGVAGTAGIDYTASNGTSVTLTVAPTAGAIVDIIAFKSFLVSDTVSASAGGTFAGNVTVPQLTATNVALPSNWAIVEVGGGLIFQHSGISRMRLDTSGNLIVTGNVTAYGSI